MAINDEGSNGFYMPVAPAYGGGSEQGPVELPPMSYAAPEPTDKISFDSGSEFSDAIRGMEINAVLDVIDELMGVLQTINPRLYNGVMRRLER